MIDLMVLSVPLTGVAGVPLVLYGSQYPGGKIFSRRLLPAPGVGEQGDFGRNVLRGFGAVQADVGFQRQIDCSERVKLRFGAEFFNIFNHPNFGPPNSTLTIPWFGYSTQILANSLGSGGAKRRTQSALPDWRPPLDPTRAEIAILR